ncbi:MAG: hypothetical protein JWN95_150 [Frankiales bacterium]|nr:hypothetical protein [Frankiales bacterium]
MSSLITRTVKATITQFTKMRWVIGFNDFRFRGGIVIFARPASAEFVCSIQAS